MNKQTIVAFNLSEEGFCQLIRASIKAELDAREKPTILDERGNIYLAMKITGYSETRIRKLIEKNAIPFNQPGGKGSKIIFSRSALENWVKEGGTI